MATSRRSICKLNFKLTVVNILFPHNYLICSIFSPASLLSAALKVVPILQTPRLKRHVGHFFHAEYDLQYSAPQEVLFFRVLINVSDFARLPTQNQPSLPQLFKSQFTLFALSQFFYAVVWSRNVLNIIQVPIGMRYNLFKLDDVNRL